MNLSQSIETLYKVVTEDMGLGPDEAKELAVGAVFLAITDLQDQNLPVTGEAIEKLVVQKAKDYLEVAKSKVA